MHHRFSAGNRNPSVGLHEVRIILTYFFPKLLWGDFPTDHRQGIATARKCTYSTTIAFAPVDDDRVGSGLNRPPRTYLETRQTMNTPLSDVLNLWFQAPCLRVMTPLTSHVAALHKNDRPYARAIMYRHALKRCDQSFHDNSFPLLQIYTIIRLVLHRSFMENNINITLFRHLPDLNDFLVQFSVVGRSL